MHKLKERQEEIVFLTRAALPFPVLCRIFFNIKKKPKNLSDWPGEIQFRLIRPKSYVYLMEIPYWTRLVDVRKSKVVICQKTKTSFFYYPSIP